MSTDLSLSCPVELESSVVNHTEMEDKEYIDSWERVNHKQMFKQRQTLEPNQDLQLENRFSLLEKKMATNLMDSEEETKLDNATLESKLPHRKLLKKQKGSRQKKFMGKLSDNLCGNLKENVNSTIQWQRCAKCFNTHYPYPKFCRWTSNKMTKISFHAPKMEITKQLKAEIKIHIARIENREKVLESDIIETFLKAEKADQQFPNLILENQVKRLRGGSKVEKIKKFVSKTNEYNTVLNSLRSSKIFEQFNFHEKCPIEDACGFCLLRSLIIKVNSKKGRETMIPVELESQLGAKSQKSPYLILKEVLEKCMSTNQDFKRSIKQHWKCSRCSQTSLENENQPMVLLGETQDNKKLNFLLKLKMESLKRCCVEDEFYLGEEARTCIFKGISMDVDLLEIINMGNGDYECVGAISKDGFSYFRVGNKWFESNQYTEIRKTEVNNIEVAIYDRKDMEGLANSENFFLSRKGPRKIAQ